MIFNNLEQLNQKLADKGRLIALDLGTKTIGVAICDATWLIANPKLTLARKGGKFDFQAISQIIKENNIQAIIIGLPLNMDGSESKMSEFVRKFAFSLDKFLFEEQLISKIAFMDERLSSFAAEEIMEAGMLKNNKRKQLVDQIAASIILSNALQQLKVL